MQLLKAKPVFIGESLYMMAKRVWSLHRMEGTTTPRGSTLPCVRMVQINVLAAVCTANICKAFGIARP
jgi:hypothetical protein